MSGYTPIPMNGPVNTGSSMDLNSLNMYGGVKVPSYIDLNYGNVVDPSKMTITDKVNFGGGNPININDLNVDKQTPTNWGMDGWGGVGLGLGQLGLGIMNYLEMEKTAKLDRQLKNQQIANNDYTMQKRKDNSAHLKSIMSYGQPTPSTAQNVG
jgi:hypothetical protein